MIQHGLKRKECTKYTKYNMDEETFRVAVDTVNKNKLRYKHLPDETKLRLYGLYKQATVGDVNIPEPSIFSYTSRQKWKAWNEYEGLEPTSAMLLYVRIVNSLGQ